MCYVLEDDRYPTFGLYLPFKAIVCVKGHPTHSSALDDIVVVVDVIAGKDPVRYHKTQTKTNASSNKTIF